MSWEKITVAKPIRYTLDLFSPTTVFGDLKDGIFFYCNATVLAVTWEVYSRYSNGTIKQFYLMRRNYIMESTFNLRTKNQLIHYKERMITCSMVQ